MKENRCTGKAAGAGNQKGRPLGMPARVALAIGIPLMLAGILALAVVMPGMLSKNGDTVPDAPAEAATTNDAPPPADGNAEQDKPSAASRLTADRTVTERDLATIADLREFLDGEVAARTATAQLKTASGEATPEPMPLDDLVTSLSTGGAWSEEIPGWGDLLLMVRCAEAAQDAVNDGSEGAYRPMKVATWGNDAPEDTYVSDVKPAWANDDAAGTTFAVDDPVDREAAKASGAKVDDSEQPLGEVGMYVTLVGMSGDEEALVVPAAVDLSGTEPRVLHRRAETLAARMRMRRRIDDIAKSFPAITHDNAAIEGNFRASSDPSGNITRSERLWLYVDENAIPTDIPGFIDFVNGVHAALAETAPEGTVDISVKVVAVAPDDPIMRGYPLSELQHQLEIHNDPGSAYMQFAYRLGGEATSGSPCVEGDLDGYMHPYDWGM